MEPHRVLSSYPAHGGKDPTGVGNNFRNRNGKHSHRSEKT